MNELVKTKPEIQLFQNAEFGTVRTIIIDGEPWFVAKDVCDILDINNSRQAMTRLENFEKNTVILNDGNKGNPNMTVISESGFYALVLSSRKPIAKPFRIWVTCEVLPSIRKTGKYESPNTTMEHLLAPLADIKTMYAQVNHIEDTMNELSNVLAKVINYTTINYQQQNELLQLARERVNYLLGGAKSPLYKKRSRTYFKNLWLNFCDVFACDSYKNLNPLDFDYAKDWILEWNYHVA